MKEPTSTSYAILGLLAVKPWTPYELAKQVERMSNFWPRAASKIYEEPKHLVERGWAKARKEKTGNRPRTVYSITPKGRKALAAWLETPGAGPVLEFESFLKVFFGEHGSKRAILENLRAAERWAMENHAMGREVAAGHVAGESPFPERLHVISLCYPLLWDFAATVKEWARWAQAHVEAWPEPPARGPVLTDMLRRAAGAEPDSVERLTPRISER